MRRWFAYKALTRRWRECTKEMESFGVAFRAATQAMREFDEAYKTATNATGSRARGEER